jgi:pantoate--beta-alanine ligase
VTSVLRTVASARQTLEELRSHKGSVGLVPTMGALHEGHLSLIRRAKSDGGLVVVSIFVNPAQFDAKADLRRYPRSVAWDRQLAQDAGADLVFVPTVPEMYPADYSTWVDVENLTAGMCGRSRPGHFRGVCTVVAKLLNIFKPQRAYFGEKDAQQLAVISRMVRDLDMEVEIVPCRIVREADGLAMSSRNVLLEAEERTQAPLLYQGLVAAQEAFARGERDARALESRVRSVLARATLARVDYVEVVSKTDLSAVESVEEECLVASAVWFGDTRLIDNITIGGNG